MSSAGNRTIPFHAGPDGRLKQTRTLCPTCLRPVVGTTYHHDGKVYLRRECPDHGPVVSLVSSDRRHYYLRDEVPHPPPDGQESAYEQVRDCPDSRPTKIGLSPCEVQDCSCGLPGHKTCLALLEVTEACNLRCPVCFAQSPRATHRAFPDLCADLETFLTARAPLDVLQLSGGEPLLHPDLLRIIDHCRSLPIKSVMINTNGLELVRNPALAPELAKRRKRLELFLQFDGLDAATYLALRGADLAGQKQAILRQISRHHLHTTLACTLVKGVNEHEVGRLIRLGLETRAVRGITFQPATWSGRFDRPVEPLDRLTLADVVHLVVQQSEGLFDEADFRPLPCSNPNCCSFTYALRRRKPAVALSRLTRYEDHVEHLADRVLFEIDDARTCCGLGWRPEDFLRVLIKPFMDAYTYDQDRVDECCVHVIRPGGGSVSFCRFNTLDRGRAAEASRCSSEALQDV